MTTCRHPRLPRSRTPLTNPPFSTPEVTDVARCRGTPVELTCLGLPPVALSIGRAGPGFRASTLILRTFPNYMMDAYSTRNPSLRTHPGISRFRTHRTPSIPANPERNLDSCG